MHILMFIQRLCLYECVCVCILTARQTVLRLCRRSSASWGLARYWGSSACSSRMENGTMEPGQEGVWEGGKEDKKKTGERERVKGEIKGRGK